ncbi:hypothetical protein [Flagellimonas sp. GZD32]|uniref:hypothetical protein n=1 Tax=Flagellimonas cixiensis TaxID=3228750 RepID=UPI0035C8CFBB
MGSIKGIPPEINIELIFSEDDYGRPISERLSEVLRRNLTKNDFANVAIRSGVSFSTIRDVVYRTNSLTKANAMAISLVMHAAFENSIAYKFRAEGDLLFLGKYLDA